MYNPDHHQFAAPRISFSGDFAVEPPPPPPSVLARPAGDADFEFSVGSQSMMAADQLFSKGRILPLREAGHGHGHCHGRPVTLRDELRSHDADGRHGRAPRAPSSVRWKELLGLKKAHKKDVDAAGAGTSADTYLDLGGHGGMTE